MSYYFGYYESSFKVYITIIRVLPALIMSYSKQKITLSCLKLMNEDYTGYLR